MHGKGKLTYPNGEVYEGEWVFGKRQGHGTDIQCVLGDPTGSLQLGDRGLPVYHQGPAFRRTWRITFFT